MHVSSNVTQTEICKLYFYSEHKVDPEGLGGLKVTALWFGLIIHEEIPKLYFFIHWSKVSRKRATLLWTECKQPAQIRSVAQFLSCTLHAWWWPGVVLGKATACSADAIQEVVWGKEDLIAHGLPGICCMERGRCIPSGTRPLTRSLQVARCICEGVGSGKLQGKFFFLAS